MANSSLETKENIFGMKQENRIYNKKLYHASESENGTQY
jgi:hypothetical protein